MNKSTITILTTSCFISVNIAFAKKEVSEKKTSETIVKFHPAETDTEKTFDRILRYRSCFTCKI